MILDSLELHEVKFKSYDCTEQCNGMCMNGYISSRSVVLNYVAKINSLFQDEEFLNEQQREFDELNENLAFTEMRAYDMFKKCKECGANFIRLNTIIDGSTFDDAIRQEHGMEMEQLLYGKDIKKMYLSPDGRFYCYHKKSDSFVKMNSLNLTQIRQKCCKHLPFWLENTEIRRDRFRKLLIFSANIFLIRLCRD